MSRDHKSKTAAPVTECAGKWTSLTLDDLDDWAGSRSVSRGRSYQRQRRVKQLAISQEGRLLAMVIGGDRYVVSVWLMDHKNNEHPIQWVCPKNRERVK